MAYIAVGYEKCDIERADIDIFDTFRCNKDDEKAVSMRAYMRDRFLFLGIYTPRRKELSRRFFNTVKKTDLDWDFIFNCWQQPEREFQYLAKEYLAKQKANLTASDILRLRELAVQTRGQGLVWSEEI